MSKNRVATYIVSHFVGDQSLAWSFFVNGLAFYLLSVAFVVALGYALRDRGLKVMLILFLCAMAWSLVGNTMSAIKTLKSRESGLLKKSFAVLVIGVVFVVVFTSTRDLMRMS